MYLAGVIDSEGVVRGEMADTCPYIVADDRTFRYVLHRTDAAELSITQNDVRAIQLAKAALRAGIDLLMEHAGVESLDDMRLAGAFGAHIDPLYALVLGLVPDCAGRGGPLRRQRRRRRRCASVAVDAGARRAGERGARTS